MRDAAYSGHEVPPGQRVPWTLASGVYEMLVGGSGSTWTVLNDQSERYRRLSVPLARCDCDFEAEHRRLVDATLWTLAGRFRHIADIILAADPVSLRGELAA